MKHTMTFYKQGKFISTEIDGPDLYITNSYIIAFTPTSKTPGVAPESMEDIQFAAVIHFNMNTIVSEAIIKDAEEMAKAMGATYDTIIFSKKREDN